MLFRNAFDFTRRYFLVEMMRSTFLCAAVVLATAQTTVDLVFQQTAAYAVYTSATLSRHNATPNGGDDMTFGAGTWLNPPIGVEVYDVTGNGTKQFTFTVPNKEDVFQIDSARHNLGDYNASGAADMFTAVSVFAGPGSCSVGAFASLGSQANGIPIWNYTIPECQDYLLYDQTRMIDASDDGSTLAFAAYANETFGQDIILTARLYVFEAQTGETRFIHDLGQSVAPGGGGVATSESGNWIAYTNSPNLYIIDGYLGTVRDTIAVPWGGVAPQITDTGDFVVLPSQDAMLVYKWNSATGHYALQSTIVPSGPTQWYPDDLSVSTIDANTQYACMGWIIGSSLQARITIYSLIDGSLVSDYTTPLNTQLQTSATVRMDRNYCGGALWGDTGTGDNVPTSVLLQAGSNTPVFTYVTPGSNFGLDVLVGEQDGSNDVVYLAVSGKAVPANQFGNGGAAFVWKITTPSAGIKKL